MGLNHVYKVIWNKTKGCYVVVSELAKRVGRNKAKAIVMSTAAMAMAVSPVVTSTVGAVNPSGTGGDEAVAWGNNSTANGVSAAIGNGAQATGGDSFAVLWGAKATGSTSMAIGNRTTASGNNSVALGSNDTTASGNSAVAIGEGSKAQGGSSVALGEGANAINNRSVAIGKGATIANGDDTIAIGSNSQARGNGGIVIGKNSKITDGAADGAVVIGQDAFSEGSVYGNRPNTVVGRGAYTAFGENGTYRINASTAIGMQAGAGVIVDPNNNRKLVSNNTNADSNAEVLVKAGYGVDENAPADTKAALQAGSVHDGLVFYRKNHINEGTAIGVESRAVGDQSIAIGGQVVAGDGVVALGGNDTDQLRGNKYQVATDNAVANTNVSTIDDYNLSYKESERTVAGQYEKLVGRGMPAAYKSTYGQSGSVVIGMEAHSTTALGTAIGTNSVVRMGAFGATAIGAGSTVQPNAEAAVAIGMGSVANGAYALAAGTASWAEYGDIAMGYKANASGKQGAIAIGQSTNAKGDSSVMIGGANISNAAGQATTYDAEKKNPDGSRETYTKDVTERINGQDVTRKYTYVATEKKSGKVSDAYAELTGKTMNISEVDYNLDENKNGHASTSVGVHSLAKGDLASAYGAGSRASAIGALALGTGAEATRQNAVAIGTGSTTDLTGTRQLDASYDKDGKWVASDSPDAVYTFKWAGGLNTSEGDVVSFGSSGAERQLKNVAAGRIAEDSTDAINGSQVNSVIEKFIAEGVKYFSVNSTVDPNRQNKGATGTDAIAIGPSASATNTNALATGTNATATGESATAYGTGTKASETGAVAIGSTITNPDATTASTEATGANATAVGAGAQATALDSTAVGALSEAKAAEAIAIGSKAKSESAAGVAIGQNAQVGVAATQGLALGQNTTVSTVGGVALGVGSVASVASGVSGIGVDGEADGTARVNKYAKFHDNVDHALTSGQGAVSVGGTLNNTPFTRQITGLAAGTNDTDAVNVAQLKSVNLAFKGNTGTGDVRLHDQRLTVESDNTDLLTVTASDKKLTLTPKTTPLTVDSTAGSPTLGKVTVPTTNALATAQDVANAINAAHWTVATSASTATGANHTGDSNKAVHAGETVKFIAGEHVTIDQNGRDITISMKDAVTNIMVKDQIQSSFENGDNTTFSVNPETGKLRYDVNPKATYTTVQTGNTVVKDGAVTNLTDHLPSDAVTSGTKPVLDEGNKEGNQAATVNDVLNAGWNLQNNDAPKDFVKPYDTVNFADGMNTTAVVTVSADGKTSSVRYSVTGLPITYTTETGAPVSKVGDRYYTVGEDGIPVGPTGNKAVAKNANGDLVDAQGNVIAQIDPSKTPLKTNLVNPNVENTTGAPNARSTTPTQLGNVGNGGVTHNLRDADGTELALAKDGNYYDATKVNPDGSPATGVTPADAKTPVVLANDGKWYPKDKVSDRGELKDPTATPVVPGITATSPTAGLIDFGKSNPNNVATIGDLRNMGWVVSAPTNGYLDQVRNANQVDFIGKNGVSVTGETKNGIRTITVETPEEAVVFKGPDGTSLIKTEKGYVPENSVKIDGNYYPPNTTKDPVTGNIVNNGAPVAPVTPVPREDVVTSMNSKTPKTLNNVKNTLPNVNDGTKTVTNPDGSEGPNPGDVSNINKAPITAEEAAKLSNPKTADGQPNTNYKGSNAATVSDVLNAGWNLQTNGSALDFVKPYDTVNFADGGNTTVVSSTDGTISKIQVNVTGLPVSNTVTDAQGNQVPVTKVGNTYFPVKADGTPDIQRDAKGNPTNGYTIANDGNIYPSNQTNFIEQPDGTKTVTPRGGVNPTTINTNLANPNVPNGEPTKGVNTPTPLGNVANGANTINPISTTGVPLKQAKDGKWYDATKVDDQGNKLPDANNFEGTPAVLANDGKWYEAGKVDEKGTPKADAQPINNPLTNKTANGGLINFANSNPNNAATVGDLQNMGWIVGAPGNNYADQVRNANQVNFVGKNLATVTGETDGNGIRTITIDVNEQKTVEAAHTPVVYTDSKGDKLTKLDNGKFYDADKVKALGNNVTEIDGKLYPADAVKVGDKYYPAGTVVIDNKPYPKGSEKGPDGVITNPKGLDITEIKGLEPVTDAKASMNNTDGSTTNPFPLANVGSNLKQVVDPKGNLPGKVNATDGETKVGDTTNAAPYTAAEVADMAQRYQLNPDGTIKTEKVPVIDPATNSQKLDENGAPVFEDKKLLNPNFIGNNAATVSDVLNAGWNLQNNGEARDFVKPYDTVNFVNGANTTAVVTTSEDGTTSKVTFNVTGLPVAYTDADGNKVAKIGDKYYKVNDKGQPLDEQGQPSTKVNDKGVPVNADGQEIPSVNVANTSLVNPTPENGKTSTTSPTALNNVTSNLSNYTDKDVDGKAPAKNALRNLDNKDVSDNTAATVGDLRNMGWIVSSDKKTGDLGNPYSEAVKNANEVKFIGTGAAVVSGNTVDGVRTITVSVDNQVATNNSVTPVVYTDKEGNTVYPIKDDKGNVTYHTTPNGTGNNDSVVPNDQVNTSVNGPKDETTGKVRPASLGNVKNNIPTVNDEDKKAYNVDGTPIADKNNTAAPITAADAADLLKPMKDGAPNPKFVGNNAATVSDVLNAGWNLTGNGKAVDFVKPYDTVNFRDGGNTTVTVTTDDNLTSHVQVNVTGLPVANTITDPTTGKQVPVVKVGDTFYPANPDGTPNIQKDATTKEPTNGYVRADDGKFYPREDVNVTPAADPTQPPTITPKDGKTPTTVNTNLANPNVSNTTDNPGNNVNTPSQLGNVANGAKTFDPVAADGTKLVQVGDKFYPVDKVENGVLKPDATEADAKDPVKLANDGKWYPADQVEPNGKPKENATPVANPLAPKNADGDVLEKGNDGKWYKAADLTNGKPADNAAEQTPVARPANSEKSGLIDFTNSNPNNAATIGDLQNMGWVVSAEGNSYSDQVRNANEVKFVGEGTATVTGKTDENGVRTITVKVDDQVSTNNAVTPVVYTDKEGNTVYPIKDDKGNVTYHTTPDGKGENDKVVPNGDVNTSINGPKDEQGNTRPASLGNVKNNIPTVNDADKKAYNVDGTPIADKSNTAAPITAADAADLLKPMKDGKANPNFVGNNAATVSDVLNTGWNLQGNGTNVDFVKPYDTVNFRDGGNTTVTVTTDDNLTSHVQVNVTGLPVANTITDPTTGKQVPVVKVGDTFYPANPDGTPNIQKDAATGEPTNGYVRADDGKFYPREDVTVTPAADPTKPATVTPKAGKTPTTVNTNLANPNVANTTDNPGNNVNTPSQLGNVANGANTFSPVDADGNEYVKANNGKYYAPDKVNEDGSLKEGTDAVADAKDPLVLANDGKWYKSSEVQPNGTPIDTATSVQPPKNTDASGLVDFSKSNPNNAATVGDLQNLGWIVSAEGNDYTDQVRNANEVRFVGEGSATVTGKTDENGVRTITVSVDDQVSTNNAITPVNYTTADGTKVYPLTDEDGNVTYHTTPDGTGDGDQVIAPDNVITSLNGPKGTKSPTTLNNVKNNIPAVNDADKKVTNPDGTEAPNAGDVANINKAPLTAEKAADLLNPKTKDGKANPNFAGNNAATVSDVLNAGWNLQNNGTAKDFVKPFDTVNFVNGGNTTAVVTTNDKGTVSDVTFNVTGLPITYTTAEGKPVSKVGDKFYTVNEQGQPITKDGKPAVTTNAEGKPVTKDGTVIEPINTTDNPLQSNLVNPNVTNTADAPNNQTTTPTQLGNVANGANTFAPVDNKVLANDGKWYNATDVAPNGKPKDGVTPVEKPANVGKEGLIDFENSKPNNAATVGDLQNLGFVVSAKDNGYTDQVRNANKVEFKGTNGVEVTGKTLEDGTREITVGLKEGKVTNDVIVTKEDGTETHAVRGEDGKVYEKDPVTGKATTTEIPVGPKDTIKNDGDSFVNGNAVATAIQKSGWNIGIGSTDKAFSTDAKTFEKVNPNDNVKYVNGANTTVSMAVDEAEDKDGTKVTTTYVKVDVNRDLNIDSVTTGGPAKDKDGNPLKLVDGKYYPENALVQDGKAYPAGTTFIDGKPYPAGAVKDPKTNTVVKDGQPATEVQPLTATDVANVAPGKDGAMTVKDAKGNDGVSATAKDGKGTLTLNNAKAGKDGKDAASVAISTDKAPADLDNTPKDAVRANDGKWYAPTDVDVKTENGKTVVTPKDGKSPIADAPTMDRIQYTGADKKVRDVATMDDGLRFQGDDGESISKPLNSTVQLTGGNREDTGKPVVKDATTTGNIGVFNTDGKLSVQLAKDLDKLNSANFESKTDKAGNPLKVVDGQYYPEKAVVKEGKVYPEGTVIIDNKPYPAGTTKDAAGKVVNNGKPATEAKPITPIDSKQVQDGPTSKLTGTGLTFNTPTPKDEKGNPLVLVDGKYYKADNLENGKPKADAKPEPVKPAQSTAFTPDGLVVTPETAKVRDANGNPVLDKDGREVVDPTKVVSFGSPTIVVDPKTGKPMVDPKTGEPVMKSGISAGGQVMANVAPGVLDTDAVNVSQLKGVSNMVVNVNNRVNRLGAQAAAMAGLRHLQYDPLEPTTIMAGIGTYKGEGALALGIAHYKNESTLFHAGASIGSRGDELMANAGVSWKFGARADETAVKDTFRQGPISASYTLQDKVSALEAQNQMQKDEINTLKAQLAEVLQYIKKG